MVPHERGAFRATRPVVAGPFGGRSVGQGTFDGFSQTADAGVSRRSGWKLQIDGFERLLNAIQQTSTKI
jgi:hypothetical protein